MARKKILLYRTSGSTAPTSSNIDCGELAMSYLADNEKLYMKNSKGAVVSFIACEAISTDELNKLINGM